jgi:CheY-like chemotaxis protein
MIDTERPQTPEHPPASFVGQVKDGLEHLYDLGYLQHHPWVQEDTSSAGDPVEVAAQRIRRELAAAIEALNPGDAVPVHAPHARPYHLLVLHYMQGATVRETAYELGYSERQAYRDLRRGEECVAEILWSRRTAAASPAPGDERLAYLQQEIARVEDQVRPTDLRALVESAREAVGVFAEQRGVALNVSSPAQPLTVATHPILAEQCLISLLSHTVGHAERGTLDLTLVDEDGQLSIALQYARVPEAAASPAVDQMTVQLADQLGWTVRQADLADGQRQVVLLATPRHATLLVIDDNEGLVELFERYLTNCACRIVAATSGQQGLALAQEHVPDAIVLDVMMPGMHGWQVLQRLQNHPLTSDIPVIVCSVINIPELAEALGAALFLPKPVSQDSVLGALREVGVL